MTTPEDWHPEQIKAAIRMRGTTLTALALSAGYRESAVIRTLRHCWPAVEQIIAQFLGVHPQDIWPSRYDGNGASLQAKRGRPRSNRRPQISARLRQKMKAA